MQKHRIEILAPAGDAEMLRAAVFSGADCVYVGVKGFNARRGAGNFGPKELAAAAAFCHARGCKIYAALNTLVLPGEEDAVCAALRSVAKAGCDALIVQDLAVAALAKREAPGIPLHASTQMSVHSLAGVQVLHALGFERAILARELSEEELAHIARHSPIQLEVFVHGALCVSVSGQCYASAFLGGRSGNRGGCAGPCRLPFRASDVSRMAPRHMRDGNAAAAADYEHTAALPPAQNTYALSLKDLSILAALPRLEQMGIASAKIEGRLRGPEYVATVVDAARKALDGEEYNKELLQIVFSRSGFTDGWFTGQNGADMFGARTDADFEAAKKQLPKARELYRREAPRVPVQMALRLGPNGAALQVDDGTHTVRAESSGPLAPAREDPAAALQDALTKTGGTPFYSERPPAVHTDGLFLPAGEAARLRREALGQLLELRGAPPPVPTAARSPETVPPPAAARLAQEIKGRATAHRRQTGRPLLWARFETLAHMPPGAAELCDGLLLPLWQAEEIPEALRARTILWLPRVLFGARESEAAQRIQNAQAAGFAGFEAQNIAHFGLCRGLPAYGGFGLNVTNAAAAAGYFALGASALTLSAELSLPQMAALARGIGGEGPATGALCYGHLPLMLTRACPLKQLPAFQKCDKVGVLVDRMGEAFRLSCDEGARSVHNPVPLWMADRLAEMPIDCATLYFTHESPEEADAVLRAFVRGEKAPGRFTRGLYTRGVSG